MSAGLLRRVLVGSVLMVNVAVLGLVTSSASDTPRGVPAADPIVPLPPPLGGPSPTPKPSPKPTPASPKVAPPEDRWALLFGITNYRAPVHDTVAGAQDVAVVRDTLLRSGWRSDHIKVLTDGAATGKALQDGLSWLIARSGTSTFSLFHYSGHVKQRDGHEYLWPVDNAFYSDTSVTSAMKNVRGISWTSIAGCEAAGFNDGLAAKNRLFTASSAADEKSYENPDWRMSVWVGVLWDQGLRRKAGDTSGDGVAAVQEVFRWGAPRAAEITRNQRPHGPQHPYLAGGSGSLRLDAPVVG
jgi:hypothetical protein